MLRVNDIFYSLSGEISKVPQGTPVVFVRLSGCNFKCSWCDTDHSKFRRMEIQDVKKEIKRWNCKIVIITGGEPLLQKLDLSILCHELNYDGYMVMIETNGSINPILKVDYWMLDYKIQYSDRMILDHFRFGKKQGLIKIIVGDIHEFNSALSVFDEIQANKPSTDFLFCVSARQPLDPHELAQWVLKSPRPITLNTQLHKIIDIK